MNSRLNPTRLTQTLSLVAFVLIVCAASLKASGQSTQPSPQKKESPAPTPRAPKKKLSTSADFSRYAGRDASNRLIAGAATRIAREPPATDPATVAYRRGKSLFNAGKYVDAAVAFSEAVRLSPSSDEAHYGLASALARQGEHEKALAEFGEALRLASKDELRLWSYYGMGNVYAEQEEYEEAVKAFREAVKVKPELSKPHYNLGMALLGLGTKDEALREFTEAVRINPKYAEARFNLGVLALESGNVVEANEQHQQLLSLSKELASRLGSMLGR